MYKATIPMRLPSLNEYINACRTNKYMANSLKKKTQEIVGWYLRKLPEFKNPVRIKFIWVSKKGDRRDLDNICFAKKFILDALQEIGKISNDNRKCVVGFSDAFEIGSSYEVKLEIEEITNDNRQDLQL
jgi:Holliday junction resolvase RusA-like endonuclease